MLKAGMVSQGYCLSVGTTQQSPKLNYYRTQQRYSTLTYVLGLEGSRSFHYIFTLMSYNATCEKVKHTHPISI